MPDPNVSVCVSVCAHSHVYGEETFRASWASVSYVISPVASLGLDRRPSGLLAAWGLPTGGSCPPSLRTLSPSPFTPQPQFLSVWEGGVMQTPAVGACIAREAGGQLSSPAITCLHRPLDTVTGPLGEHSPLCSHCSGQKPRRHADHSPSLRPHIQASSRSLGFDFQNVFRIQ